MPTKLTRLPSIDLPAPSSLSSSALTLVPQSAGGAGALMAGMGTSLLKKASAATVVWGAVDALTGCLNAFLSYSEQKELTKRTKAMCAVWIERAREQTRQISIQADAFVEAAREHRREVEAQCESTRAELEDRRHAREAKLTVLNGMLSTHDALVATLSELPAGGESNLAPEERAALYRRRDAVSESLRNLQNVLAQIALTL
jgi:hypothetical protein